MRFVGILLVVALTVVCRAQQPLHGLGLELSTSFLLVPKDHDQEDNILDRDRNNALTFNATLMLHDSSNFGRGLGRMSIGLGTGLLWWEEELLMPIYLQANWYPFIREKPLCGIHLNRLAFIPRAGGALGAWKETTLGQLSIGFTTQVGLRYPILKNGSMWLEGGYGWMDLRGPYQHKVDGVWLDEDEVRFYHIFYSLGFQF